MIRRFIVLLSAFALAAAVGCSGGSDEEDTAASFRAAIPSESLVTSAELQAPPARTLAAVNDPALYPWFGIPVAWAINGVVVGHFAIMRFVVSLPHAYFDPVEQVMAWGPFPNEEGGDIVVFIMRNADYDPSVDGSFEFVYQFLRVPEGWDGPDGDEVPVLVGVSNPNAPGGPAGVFFVDFDASADFPYDVKEVHTLGGFAAAYNQVPVIPESGTDPGGLLTAVVAVFRDFVPEDDPQAVPANVDYLYGHFDVSDEASTTMDFLEFETSADIHDPASLAEMLDVRMAFLNGKQGRAEVSITGGDLGGTTLKGIECWSDIFARQYLSMADYDSMGNPIIDTDDIVEGIPADAGPIFSQSLDDLHIPSLEMLDADDPTILPLLSDLATCGDSPCPPL